MKAIMMSIRPRHDKNILNDIKTLEIRKKFPKDYVGWVYIYVTKGKPYLYGDKSIYEGKKESFWCQKIMGNGIVPLLNGKVIARFWCDNVEEITTWQDRFKEFMFYETSLDMEDLLKQSCLDYNELDDYLEGKNGYAIHITNLEIFYETKELNEFGTLTNKCNGFRGGLKPLTRAPQSWCYIEVEQ